MRSRGRTILLLASCTAACLAAALLGATLALLADGETETSTSLGVVSAEARLAPSGRIDAYVPLLDWGVRVRPYRAPLALDVEIRSVDRTELLAAFRSSADAGRRLESAETEVREGVERELVRAALSAPAGAVLGGLFAGALFACFRSRRWLIAGPALGLAGSGLLVGILALGLARFDTASFREPTFFARGEELPKLLSFSAQFGETGERYTDSYEQALDGVAQLLSTGVGEAPPGNMRTAIVASDLHSNAFALDVLDAYTEDETVYWIGDFTQLGTRYEEGIVEELTASGRTIVAVSGNHDSRSFMRALAREGVVVLTRRGLLRADGNVGGGPLVEVDGLTVAGFDDPLETEGDGLSGHDLELSETERLEAQSDVVAWFDALPERPDVVLVHQHALAHALLEHVRDEAEQLLVLTGHDHRQHLEQAGAAVLVDGGTAGAGGPFAIGKQPAGFAQLHFDATSRLSAVDLIQVEPLSGAARAERLVIEDPSGRDASPSSQP